MGSDARIDEAAALVAAAAAEGRRTLSEPEAKSVLRSLGIAVPDNAIISGPEQAEAAAAAIGLPVMVKVVAPDLTHKTEAGGVVGPVHTAAAAAAACEKIARNVRRHQPDVAVDAFLVEAYRPASPEWILGARIDPVFGPTIMFGLGGIYVDILRQVSFRLAPMTERDIEELITEQPAMRILEGVRGRPPADREALKRAIRALSRFAARADVSASISEIEINPFTIGDQGVLALDALVVLHRKESF